MSRDDMAPHHAGVCDCICADPENCTQAVPGYRCRKSTMNERILHKALSDFERKNAAEANYQLGYAIGLLRHALRSINGMDNFREQTEADIREFLAKYPGIGR